MCLSIFRGEAVNLNEVSVGEIFSRETEGKHFWMKVLPYVKCLLSKGHCVEG